MARPALSASRALAVLDALAATPASSMSLTEVVERLGINNASAHAVLAVLAERGYVTRDPRRKTYSLGAAAVALGSAALERHPVFDHARDAARRLADELGLEVSVSAPAGADIVFYSHVGTPQPSAVPIHVGQRVPLRPPLGSVFAAFNDSAAWLAEAPGDRAAHSVGRADALAGALAEVRRRGYAVALDSEQRRRLGAALDAQAAHPADEARRATVEASVATLRESAYHLAGIEPRKRYDVSTIAAPVFDAARRAVVALTLIGFAPGLTGAQVVRYGQAVRDAGILVTRATGGRLPS